MRLLLCLAVLIAGAARADEVEPKDSKAPVAREIAVPASAFPAVEGRLGDPLKITTAAELAAAVADANVREAIARKVNLKRENLLVYRWSGSGMDRLTLKAGKGNAVTFTYRRGLTRDLRMHVKAFAVPKKATYRVVD